MKHPWLAWYPGDYLSKTRYLSMSQHGAYLLLLWEYYINGPIPARIEQVLNICCARSQENRSDVEFVLTEFFALKDGKYHHQRADEEIVKREDIRSKRVKAGQARQHGNSTRSAHAKRTVTQSQSHIKPPIIPLSKHCSKCGGTGVLHQMPHVPGPRLIPCNQCQTKAVAN